jgi:parallel beta-helix repeat protein
MALVEARRTSRRSAAVTAAVLVCAGVAVAVDPAHAAATVLYVGGPGCSNTGAGTQAVPFCTIGAAASIAVGGQTVLVAQGTYAETVTPKNSGTVTAQIVYAAAPGAQPVVTGGTRGFYLSGKSYTTVTGFKTTGTSASGIYISKGTGDVVTNNVVTYSGLPQQGFTAYGIYLNATTHSLVSGNVTQFNTASGIYLSAGSDDNVVSGNDSAFNAEGWERNATGIDLRGARNIVVGNRVHANEDTGIQAYPGGDDSVVVGNLSYDSKGFTTVKLANCSPPPSGNTAGCITGDHGIDNFGVTGSHITGNTVYNNVTAGINLEGIASGTPSRAVITNNVTVDNTINCPDGNGGLVKCPRTRGNIRVDATSTLGTVVDRNLYYLSATGGFPGNYQVLWGNSWYTWNTFPQFRVDTGQEAHGLAADPLWVSVANRDFHLSPGSPAIDRADSAATGEQATDLDGGARVDDPATADSGAGTPPWYDLGAFEYQPPPAPAPTPTPTPTPTQPVTRGSIR